MRTLFLLRGAPGAGKSTFVEKNKLEQYCLSADKIRLEYESPVMELDGSYKITQANDGRVWSTLMERLDERMSKGEFVMVDATHYKSSLINKYKDLMEKHRYRGYIVNFTDVPLEELLSRNAGREEYKRVPEETIKKMAAVFEADFEVPGRFKIVSPDEAIEMLNTPMIFDWSNYERIVVFGDIHGCFEPLREFFEQHPYSENNMYVFTGDYLDRGIQNKEVLEFLIDFSQHKNCIFLEGNHERWLRMYAEDNNAEKEIPEEDIKILKKYDKDLIKKIQQNKIRSKEFLNYTLSQIKDINKKHIRQFCRRLGQIVHVTYHGKEFLITHGGLPEIPSIFTSTNQIIKGVGGYDDLDSVYKTFAEKHPGVWQIHAHRNVRCSYDVVPAPFIFNLCDAPEQGKDMRILQITYQNDNDVVMGEATKYKNNIFAEDRVEEFQNHRPRNMRYASADKNNDTTPAVEITPENIVAQLEESKFIRKNKQDHITSYNFTAQAFKSRKWNELTCTARGLFLYDETNKVAARSWNKFFNIKEREETSYDSLEKNLVFPVVAYRKENGFLAIISYDHVKDTVLIASKSTMDGEHVDMIKDIYYNKWNDVTRNTLIDYIKRNNVSLVFECVHHLDNTHPILYENDELYLLDIIYNNLTYCKESYDSVKALAKSVHIPCKQVDGIFNNFNEFMAFKKAHDSMSENAQKPTHEGWVFEDAAGFMFKYKTPFYRYWKYQRAIKDSIANNRLQKKLFRDERDVRVYNLLMSISKEENGREKLNAMTITDIEKLYYGDEIVPVDRK